MDGAKHDTDTLAELGLKLCWGFLFYIKTQKKSLNNRELRKVMSKAPYGIEIEHLIPLVGVYKYARKVSMNTPFEESVPLKARLREFALAGYNVLLLEALIFRIPHGLEALLK